MSKTIDKETLAELCNARDILCDFCNNTKDCQTCQVTHLIDDAFESCETELVSMFEKFKPLIDETLGESTDTDSE